MITAFPESKQVTRDKDIQFLILACDGIWDCMTSSEACEFVKAEIAKTPTAPLSTIVGTLFEKTVAEEIHSSSKFPSPDS